MPHAEKQQTLAPGARVVIRDEEWMVRRLEAGDENGSVVHVVGLSELVRGHEKIFLTELDDVAQLRPEETQLVDDPSPQYRRSRLWIESLLRRSPPTDDGLYVGHRAALRQTNYQMQPAAKALRMPRARILMADGVGLGKTIEVGVLLSELIQRGRGERILVVALKSILAQFQQELWARFTIPLVRLDSVGIQRVQTKIPSNMNPFHFYDRVIISIDTLKKEARYRTWLEQCRWDVIVIDECQNVADRTHRGTTRMAQRAKLARRLAETTDSLILTSATPHDGSAESFASLIELLDPTAIADPAKYGPEDVKSYFLRRFKKDIAHEVGDAFQDRDPDLVKQMASTKEDDAFRLLAEIEFKTIDQRRANKGVLFRTLLLKSFLSSPSACVATVNARLAHKDVKADTEASAHDRAVLERLRTVVSAIEPSEFTKYQELLRILRAVPRGERVVVFSERIDTLEFLRQRLPVDLKLKSGELEIFHGTLDDQSQARLIQQFGTEESPVRILLASDAASEGINLHYFCHRLVHFDLPWSLITLEQRNGRIDRFGQKHRPILTYLLTTPSAPEIRGDLRVLERLIEKEQQAHENLGDVAWLMTLWNAEKEEERIAAAVEGESSPEEVLPDDVTQNDLLKCLLGDNAEEEPAPDLRDPVRLFPSDVEYVRETMDELQGAGEPTAEWHDHAKGLTLRATESMATVLESLPPELREGNAVFKLTADRSRVMKALEDARKKAGEWPEWQLLWEQHPVLLWLGDRVLARFARHEAPVLRAPKGITVDERVVLFQGVVSNQRSQPVIVEWFGVRFRPGREPSIEAFRELTDRVGLAGISANPGRGLDPARKLDLEGLLPPAVAVARSHIHEQRLKRMEVLALALRNQVRRIGAWKSKKLAILDERRARATADGQTMRKDEERRLEDRRKSVDDTFNRFHQWFNEALKTIEEPYLRVVAVLIGRES